MARGGSRNGKIGAAYANRTDLQTGSKPLPVTTAPGQPYGAAKAQADAQAAIPMSGTPLPPAPAVLNGQQPEPAGPMPGELPSLLGPSLRPNEPVTHGVNVGPGGGSDVIPQPMSPVLQGLALLNSLGKNLPPEIMAVQRSMAATQANESAP